jgi:transposase
MTFEEIFLKIDRIVFLARIRGTGNPDELAERLGVDIRTLYRIIEKARRIGVCLEYSREHSSYILLPTGLQEISREDMKLIRGNGNTEEDGKKEGCILF